MRSRAFASMPTYHGCRVITYLISHRSHFGSRYNIDLHHCDPAFSVLVDGVMVCPIGNVHDRFASSLFEVVGSVIVNEVVRPFIQAWSSLTQLVPVSKGVVHFCSHLVVGTFLCSASAR